MSKAPCEQCWLRPCACPAHLSLSHNELSRFAIPNGFFVYYSGRQIDRTTEQPIVASSRSNSQLSQLSYIHVHMYMYVSIYKHLHAFLYMYVIVCVCVCRRKEENKSKPEFMAATGGWHCGEGKMKWQTLTENGQIKSEWDNNKSFRSRISAKVAQLAVTTITTINSRKQNKNNNKNKAEQAVGAESGRGRYSSICRLYSRNHHHHHHYQLLACLSALSFNYACVCVRLDVGLYSQLFCPLSALLWSCIVPHHDASCITCLAFCMLLSSSWLYLCMARSLLFVVAVVVV